MIKINEKNRRICLYFAQRTSYNRLIGLHKKLTKRFVSCKRRKHAFKGKTTKHRKGKVEQKLASCRYAVHLSATIIYFKKMIDENKTITEEPNPTNKSIENFLFNSSK